MPFSNKSVNLFVTELNRHCGVYSSSENGFIVESCSSKSGDVFLDWQSSQEKYNSYHAFGIKDSSGNGYRFIEVDSNRNLIISSNLQPKIAFFKSSDRRLFFYKYCSQAASWILQHVATKNYISIDFASKRIVLNNLETAAEVKIEKNR